MSNDFFEKPFTEDTNVKLELYKEYLKEWLPVFIGANNPFVQAVNIFDFFCGPGMDSEGTKGSPLIALDVLLFHKDLVNSTSLPINLHCNDSNKEYVERLEATVKEIGYNTSKINIIYHNKDFVELFPEVLASMSNSANLIFLDQFGIKYVNEEKFNILVNLKVTDILFFVSSSTFNRFPNDENVIKIIGLTSDEIKNTPFFEIHRLVHRKYSDMIQENLSYCLAPFSIKKGTNIYGLIFGSGHPLGMEKFLDICWNKDEETGEANFDIQGDKELKSQPSLFDEDNIQAKIPDFQRRLENEILEGNLKSDLEVYLYGINNGFTAKHIKPVIKVLKDNKKIFVRHPSFRARTVWNIRNREPQKIELLKS